MDSVKLAETKAALAELLGLKEIGFKHDATGTPTSVYAHGPEGVFSFPGVDPQMFHTVIGIESGLVGMLPKMPSLFTNPIYQTVTGVQDDTGSEPTNVCDAAVVGGLLKACKTTSVFGRYRRQTREIYLDRLGQRTDPAEPTNLRLMQAIDGIDPLLSPELAPMGQAGQFINLEVNKLLLELGVSFNRLLSRQLWQGNPANNTAGDGYKELTGFEQLVTTGYVDAEINTSCPSLDSDVKDFNYQNVDGSEDGDIVNTVTYLYRYVRSIARKTGLDPVQWVFAMREELFYELSAVWPCSYLTYRCLVRDNNQDRQVVQASDQIALRDSMRQGRYLLIDGIQVPVVFDDGIPELNDETSANLNAGEFSSDIYLIPLTVLGGTPVTYLEYFQHNNENIAQALNQGRLNQQVFITNNGAYIWTAERTRLCVFWEGKVEPRLVVRTPQVAGRIQNVKYVPLQHTRQPFPDDPYFVNGGVTSRIGYGPSYYAPWQS